MKPIIVIEFWPLYICLIYAHKVETWTAKLVHVMVAWYTHKGTCVYSTYVHTHTYIRTWKRVTLLRVSRCTCMARSAFIFLGRARASKLVICSMYVHAHKHTYTQDTSGLAVNTDSNWHCIQCNFSATKQLNKAHMHTHTCTLFLNYQQSACSCPALLVTLGKAFQEGQH